MSVEFSERTLERCDSAGKLEKILQEKTSAVLDERKLQRLFFEIQQLLHETANTARELLEDMKNTKNKQITIYDLLPLLKPGFVAMNESEQWCWFEDKPIIDCFYWVPEDDLDLGAYVCLNDAFNIAPFDGDWKDSLMEVK